MNVKNEFSCRIFYLMGLRSHVEVDKNKFLEQLARFMGKSILSFSHLQETENQYQNVSTLSDDVTMLDNEDA